MKMDTKNLVIGIVATLLVISSIGGLAFAFSQTGQFNQTESAEQTPQPTVNDSDVNQHVRDSKPGAGALKESFVQQYDYDNSVYIQKDGQIILTYNSSAQNGNQLKSEMKDVALLYADVAADNQKIGALTIEANGVLLTVPADTAIAHGNGDINEEAYFENVRFDSSEEN